MAALQSQKFSCQNPTSSTNIVHLLQEGLFNLTRQEDFQNSFTHPGKYKYKLVSQKSEVSQQSEERQNYLLPSEFYVSIGTRAAGKDFLCCFSPVLSTCSKLLNDMVLSTVKMMKSSENGKEMSG